MKPETSTVNRLFLVVLGGRTRNSHVEQHDVRWVVGISIEDTFPQLCKEWFGCQSGLHIDSLRFYRNFVYTIQQTEDTITLKGNSAL